MVLPFMTFMLDAPWPRTIFCLSFTTDYDKLKMRPFYWHGQLIQNDRNAIYIVCASPKRKQNMATKKSVGLYNSDTIIALFSLWG